MKKHFLAEHPLIGTKKNPAPLHEQQRSPYYWWWAYLKRNEEYIKCCENQGKGRLSKLYNDFGDVRSDDFPSWWGRSYQRGQDLFAEKRPEVKVMKLGSPSDWQEDWSDESVMVVAVNMQIDRRKLQSMFADLLAKEHKGKRGRKALGAAKETSTAKYPLYRNYTRHNLKTMLAVYDAWFANSKRPKGDRKPLWAIGDELKLVPTAMTSKADLPQDRTVKHNIMSATVARYVRNAKAIIANTAKGEFPNSTVA